MKRVEANKDEIWCIGFLLLSMVMSIIFNNPLGEPVNVYSIYEIIQQHTNLIYIVSILAYIALKNADLDKFYRDAVVSFCFICFVREWVIQETMAGASYNVQTQLVIICTLVEMSFIFLVFSKKQRSLIKVFIINLVSMVGIVGLVRILGCSVGFIMPAGGTTLLYSEVHMIAFIMGIASIYYHKKFEGRISQSAFESIQAFLIIRAITQGFVMIDSINHIPAGLIIYSIGRTISNYYLLKVFFFNMIRKPEENAYKHLNEEKARLSKNIESINNTKENLQLLVEEYKGLIKVLPEGIVIVENNIIKFANDKMAQLFNLVNPVSLESKNIYNLIHPIDHSRFEELIQSCSEQCLMLIHFHLLECNFAGEIKVVNMNKKDEKAYILIVKDITERLEAQRMETRLIEKEEEEKIKNQVLANISHEFKTPVNVIYAAAQLQEHNIQAKDWGGVQKYNPVIRQNCNRLIRLINNFIDLTRFDYGEFPIKKVCMNIVPVIEDITQSIVSFAENKGISVLFDTEEEEVFCEVDIELIDRMMLNLLSNAIKYNKVDGSIEVMITKQDKYVAISVKDTGIGIEKEKIEILFNRFERIDKTLARDNEGSGLGLNIVKNMIASLAGEIEVKSVFGEGTTMTIYLPIQEVSEEELESLNYYDESRLRKNVEMELSDIYE
ncbi:MAG: ATP-binding protein [Cellulosilyticaceae bacterium]